MAAGRAMALAAATALRQGVNIRAVNDEIAHIGGRTGVVGKQADLETTEEQIAELKRRASRARGLAAAATNDEVQADYEADAEKYTAAAQALRHQLRHRQTAAQQPREVERLLEVNGGRVVWALTHLARTSTVSAYSEVYAIRNIIPRVTWQPDGLLMRGTFVIHVSQQGRLLEIGPVSAVTANTARNGAAIMIANAGLSHWTCAPAFREPHQDRVLMTLLASVGLNDAACIAAITSLLPEIPAVIYASLGQKKLPTWVTDEWSDERWCRHVAKSYAPAGWTWKSRMWNSVSVGRQAIAYAVANAGGQMRFGDVVEVLRPLKITSLAHAHTRTEFIGDKWTAKRPFLAPVIRRGRGPNGIVESKLCPRCGEPATLVLRVPEIPESLACVCGGVPGLNSTIVVPPRYRHLAISPKQLEAYAGYLADADAADLA
jgi:hypothetical protein